MLSKGNCCPPFALSQPQGGLDGVERGSAWGAVFRLSRAGFYSDLNPDTVCNPRQVLPLSWESSFLLEFACLLQCTCDLWGREEDNVPKLRTFWECLGWTEVLWAARSLAGENTPASLASSIFCQEAAELLAALMFQASSVAPGNSFERGDFPE